MALNLKNKIPAENSADLSVPGQEGVTVRAFALGTLVSLAIGVGVAYADTPSSGAVA